MESVCDCFDNVNCYGEIILVGCSLILLLPILIFEIYHEAAVVPVRRVKVISQWSSLILLLVLLIYLFNPYTGQPVFDHIKLLCVHIATSIICIAYGQDVFFLIWSDDITDSNSKILAYVVRYIGILVLLTAFIAWGIKYWTGFLPVFP